MAINLAKKYSDKIAEYFHLKSVVDGNTNQDYNFIGAKTVSVYTPITQPLNDYVRSGANRYGNPAEMQDALQEMSLSRDRSFSITIDKGNNSEQMNVKEAGKMLALEMEEQVVPEMDKFALDKFAQNAGIIVAATGAPTKSTITGLIGDAMAAMSNKNVPNEGRTLYIGWTYFGLLRLSPEFLGVESLGKDSLAKGALGSFMGASVVPVPDEYLGQAYFLITHKNAVMQPKAIQDYFVKQNPPGINGALLEGRFVYDAFVLGAKAHGVYTLVPSGTKTATPTIDAVLADITVNSSANTVKITIDGSDPRYSSTAIIGKTAMVSAYVGQKITIKAVAYDNGKFASDVVETEHLVEL